VTKHIELKKVNQETALATGTLALPPLVIEGLEEFKGSFDRLCLHAGTAAIEASNIRQELQKRVPLCSNTKFRNTTVISATPISSCH
jgi:hypothetical protein